MTEPVREWIIQRCVNAFRDEYEDWPGYCEAPMTREAMIDALAVCTERWPAHEFRGHNVAAARCRRPGAELAVYL
jgi:hypothetical protein